MKKFTVKDFLLYNNPCFSCGSNINFYFVSNTKDLANKRTPGYFTPIVSKDAISIDIKKSYSHSLTLTVFNKTNKFHANNKHEMENYLEDNKLSLYSTCPKCSTTFTSKNLQFDLNHKNVKPTEILSESIIIHEDKKSYCITTAMDENKSHVMVSEDLKLSVNFILVDHGTFELDIPALPLFKFKTKENLIKKIKIYMTFS